MLCVIFSDTEFLLSYTIINESSKTKKLLYGLYEKYIYDSTSSIFDLAKFLFKI